MMGGPGSGPRKSAGRPTKLTDQAEAEIVKLVEAGNYIETAAACCGVAISTLRLWIRKGARAKSGRLKRFSDALKKAEAKAEASAVVRIRQAAAKQWQAEAWYLERKFPSKWGRWERNTVDVNHDESGEAIAKWLERKDVRDLLDEACALAGLEGDACGDGADAVEGQVGEGDALDDTESDSG